MKSALNQQDSTSPNFWFDRRSYPRRVLVRRPGVLHTNTITEPCVVVNISSGGLMARTYRPCVPGERVRMELVPGEMIAGSVLWAKDWTIGVAFDSFVDVEALLARPWGSEQAVDRRRAPRSEVSCPASLRVNARFHYGRICDISVGGARFRAAGKLRKPGPAILTLPDLPPLSARIGWIKDSDCGLIFLEELPHDALWRWLRSRETGEQPSDEPGEQPQAGA